VYVLQCLWTSLIQCTAATKMNQECGFDRLHIYGLLTDLTWFHFYSYDPHTNKFCADERFTLKNSRNLFLLDMVHSMHFTPCPLIENSCVLPVVSNKIFGLILTVFIEGLHETIAKTMDRATRWDVSCFAPTTIMTLLTFLTVYLPRFLSCAADAEW
jgi:hypothetical protein